MIALSLANIDRARSNKTWELRAKSREQRSCGSFSAADGRTQVSSRGALAEPGAACEMEYMMHMMYISDHV